ncbi:MAG: hypothetical protein ACR2QT_05480 [Woeseiaceae bacterium]
MRVAAGVLLILAAVINLFASLGYLGGGAATTGLSGMSESAVEASLLESGDMTEEEAREMAEMSSDMKGAGGMLMAMGVFLLVSVGILIAGAVFLFQSKNAKFATAAGVMALAAEGLGIAITSFGVMNLIGLVAGVLAIIAARSYGSPSSPEPEMA